MDKNKRPRKGKECVIVIKLENYEAKNIPAVYENRRLINNEYQRMRRVIRNTCVPVPIFFDSFFSSFSFMPLSSCFYTWINFFYLIVFLR